MMEANLSLISTGTSSGISHSSSQELLRSSYNTMQQQVIKLSKWPAWCVVSEVAVQHLRLACMALCDMLHLAANASEEPRGS